MPIPPEIYTLLQQISDGIQQLEGQLRPMQNSLSQMQSPWQAFTDNIIAKDSFPAPLTNCQDLIRQSSRHLFPRSHDIELCIDGEYALRRSIDLSTLFPEQVIHLDNLNFVTIRQSAAAIPRTERVSDCQKTELDQLDLDIPINLKFSSDVQTTHLIAVVSTQCFLTAGPTSWSSAFTTALSRSLYLCEDQTLNRRV